jgi:thiol-disulfide isomerase/thioredoxin
VQAILPTAGRVVHRPPNKNKNKMIRNILFVLMTLPFFSLAQRLTIAGNIKGLADGTKVTLSNIENQGNPLVQATSKNGAFTLKTKLEAATLLGLAVGDKFKTAVFLANENVKITGTVKQKPDEWQFAGSKTQNDFTEFQNDFFKRFENVNRYSQQVQSGTDSSRGLLDKEISIIQNGVDKYIEKHPQSPVSVLAILSTMNITDDIAILEKRINKLSPTALQTGLGEQLRQAMEEARFNAIGSIAPDFSQTDTSGNKITLAQFRGKYVLVDFWASWCGPCRRENPNVVKVYDKFKGKNFTVVGVSLDEDREKWLLAIKKDELAWTHISDLKGWENEVAVKYKITAIPRNLLLGPDGKILAKDLRGDDLEAKLCQLLGCN